MWPRTHSPWGSFSACWFVGHVLLACLSRMGHGLPSMPGLLSQSAVCRLGCFTVRAGGGVGPGCGSALRGESALAAVLTLAYLGSCQSLDAQLHKTQLLPIEAVSLLHPSMCCLFRAPYHCPCPSCGTIGCLMLGPCVWELLLREVLAHAYIVVVVECYVG